MSQKTGVVDVGGGMRGIYAAGVLDFCLDAGIRFDFPRKVQLIVSLFVNFIGQLNSSQGIMAHLSFSLEILSISLKRYIRQAY